MANNYVYNVYTMQRNIYMHHSIYADSFAVYMLILLIMYTLHNLIRKKHLPDIYIQGHLNKVDLHFNSHSVAAIIPALTVLSLHV